MVISYGQRQPEGYIRTEEDARSRNKEKEETGITYTYRLFLTWLIEMPKLYQAVRDKIQIEDFLDDNYKKVVTLLYEQLETGEIVPAKIINHFEDVEHQNLVANMFQTNFHTEMSQDEKEKAMNELVFKIKEYSIDQRMRSTSDMKELQSLILEKKKWQNPERLHISSKDG